MNLDVEIPWWSSRWFAFVVTTSIYLEVLKYSQRDFSNAAIAVPIYLIGVYEIWQRLHRLTPLGGVLVLFSLAWLVVSCLGNSWRHAWAINNTFFPGLIAGIATSSFVDRNRLAWRIRKQYGIAASQDEGDQEGQTGIPKEYCLEYSEFMPSFQINSMTIDLQRDQTGAHYLPLAEFDTWPTKSQALKEGRRDVLIARLKDYCAAKGIRVVEVDNDMP